MHSSFRVFRLKSVVADPLAETVPPAEPPALLDMDGDPTFIVFKILRSRCQGGQLENLVDWEGYGPEERSWAKARDILDLLPVQDFHASHHHQHHQLPEEACWGGDSVRT